MTIQFDRNSRESRRMESLLIKNATILTVDRALGDISSGDILINNGTIADVGRGLHAPESTTVDATGMIVMPGLVNAHIHVWELQLRGIGSDWVSYRDYHGNVHGNLATRYEAEDVYLGNLVGALNQINSGTTTVLDWCHVVRDAEMTDAAIDGLEESGIRAVFARGTNKPSGGASGKPYWATPYPREELHRLRTGRLASDDRMVTLAMAILGPDLAQFDVCVEDFRLAREYGLLTSAHTWARKGKRRNEDGMWQLQRLGLLGPDHNIAHGNCFEDDELKMVLDAGCSITATDLAEMLNSERVGMLGRVLKQGGFASLGTDVCPYFNSSMLWEMRHAFMHQRETDNRNLHARGAWPASNHATRTRDALEWATLGGARALRMDSRIGSITPGKQADLLFIDTGGMNVFPALPGGDPAHAVVMYAEASDIDSVMIGGRFVKRKGKLLIPERRMDLLKERLLKSRENIMRRGNYTYQPAPQGTLP
jgi:5-methylthioadenosine/S-adenosylhomocysteine deaminase